jgi:phage tail-like protein
MGILELPDRLLSDANSRDLEPIRNYNFAVQIDGIDTGQVIVGGFNVVQGLGQMIETEPIYAGGYKGIHQFTRRVVNKNVTLIKGFTVNRFLEEWFEYTANYTRGMESYFRNVIIVGLGQYRPGQNFKARAWQLYKAFPIDWSAPEFNVDSNQLAVEQLVLSYQGIKRIKGEFHAD